MPKRSAAAKKMVPEFEAGKCTVCGHDFDRHMGPGSNTIDGPFVCPALPPPRQVTVDEAVVSKGGKPSTDFRKSLEDATGVTAAKELEAKAAANFAEVIGEAETEIFQAKVKQLRPSPRNPRSKLGDLTALVASVKQPAGILSPLLVREMDGFYEIVSGHRRYAAALEAELEYVPCIVRQLTEVQAMEIAITEQLQRAEWSSLEEAKACADLQELSGYKPAQIGEKLGQSGSWATKRLALHVADVAVKKALEEKEIPLTLALAIAALPTRELQLNALKRTKVQEWQRARPVEALLHDIQEDVCKPLRGAPFDQKDASLVPSAGACETCPHNSANEKMPGLFDNLKAAARCAKPPCFDDKVNAAWEATTAKYLAEGAAVMTLEEGRNLFKYGNALQISSRYVEAKTFAPTDPSKRSWAQLVETLPEQAQPQLHVARDNEGKLRELYVADKVVQALAKAKVKWADNQVKRETKAVAKKKAAAKTKTDPAAAAEAKFTEQAREAVFEDVISTATKLFAREGLALEAARSLTFAANYDLRDFSKATGIKADQTWLAKKATLNELLAFAWWEKFREDYGYDFDIDDPAVKAIAKVAGLDVDRLFKAQLEGIKAIAAKKPGKTS